ncbi:VWA domain-containing protein [Terriglobus saanensis]|uniref:VWFA-related domain-containing protein n=1 Tax=Terriglobus saanensis (strain ATCC BAA-1853 / DSM 23119 / SP1PR4) TaxID=401053 RepID=E8UYW4_TERSS|nr:VWA domain-containing protein [Terriglobus saanensis]ADV84330.1 VWFA-related domain-containing protein [Terriglobus saanensis SP1PR4]
MIRLAVVLCFALSMAAQEPFTIPVSVNEVHVTFRAVDASEQFVTDLQIPDLQLLDNKKPPASIVRLTKHTSLPIRAGILFDTSPSMLGYALYRNRRLAAALVTEVLNLRTDAAFLQAFDTEATMLQPFTADSTKLISALRHVDERAYSRMTGTALFDTLYRACRDRFTPQEVHASAPTNNFILLFTDGADNASHAYMRDVIDICQQTHTAVYIFSLDSGAHGQPQRVLRELAEQSGGRIFYSKEEDNYLSIRKQGTNPVTASDLAHLHLIERDLRDEYELVYRPAGLRNDGKFHSIQLRTPYRPVSLSARTGYYAPQK